MRRGTPSRSLKPVLGSADSRSTRMCWGQARMGGTGGPSPCSSMRHGYWRRPQGPHRPELGSLGLGLPPANAGAEGLARLEEKGSLAGK